MTIQGKVLSASEEVREMARKDGIKETVKVSHVLLSVPNGKAVEIVNLRSYGADWPLPEIGKDWTSPRVRKYECFDGQVADVAV